MFSIVSRIATASLIAAALALGGCATTGRNIAGRDAATITTGGETAAMAATFRQVVADAGPALTGGVATYCVGTGPSATPANPNPELIAALADVAPKVVPVSQCRRGERATDAAGPR